MPLILKRKNVFPTIISSPSLSGCGLPGIRRRPRLIKVPFVEPRSSIINRSSRRMIRACRRETFASASCASKSISGKTPLSASQRPIYDSSPDIANSAPEESPRSTTSVARDAGFRHAARGRGLQLFTFFDNRGNPDRCYIRDAKIRRLRGLRLKHGRFGPVFLTMDQLRTAFITILRSIEILRSASLAFYHFNITLRFLSYDDDLYKTVNIFYVNILPLKCLFVNPKSRRGKRQIAGKYS